MDKKLKAKWVKALRSGKFRQNTNGGFHRGGAYCCLGVLAVIGGQGRGSEIHEGNLWRFIDGHVPRFASGELIDMNDSGKRFLEIADWIEKNIPATR